MKIYTMTFGFVHAYLIQDQSTFLVDTGCCTDEEDIRRRLAEAGISPEEIKYIILTHGHWDHCQAAAEWKKITGAKIICHKNAVPYLAEGNRPPYRYIVDGTAYAPFIQFMETATIDVHTMVEPDIIVGDEPFDLHSYGINGVIRYTPGHCDSACALAMDSGEVFFGDTVTVYETENGEASADINRIADSVAQIQRSLEMLTEMGSSFYGGHSGPHTAEEMKKILQTSRETSYAFQEGHTA